MNVRPRLLLPAALLAVAALTACGAPDPAPTDAALGGAGGPSVAHDTADSAGPGEQPTAGAGPIVLDGMPVSGRLHGCDELIDATVSETEADVQWRWEFLCTSREAFDASMAELGADGTLKHAQNLVAGDESYISDWHHFIGPYEGSTLDVDLKLKGSLDDLTMVYLVTLRDAE